ncbi:hypothetical protein [Lentzea sp. HUAS12]|nr:hypothetical protein [Lentzea sp. HUAS12]
MVPLQLVRRLRDRPLDVGELPLKLTDTVDGLLERRDDLRELG